jgi:hypothetical protein
MSQVSSTGAIGLTQRSDNRAYYNYEVAVNPDNLGEFSDLLRSHLDTSAINDTPVTRTVMRAVVDASSFETLSRDVDFCKHVEAATTIDSRNNAPPEYLIYVAKNALSRAVTFEEQADLIAKREEAKAQRPDIHDASSLQKMRLTDRVSDVDQLTELWDITFNWDKDGCDSFAAEIEDEVLRIPAERQKWFKGLESHDGQLLAAAMAERLDVPTMHGTLALIEHTEWATRPAHRHHRLGGYVVTSLTHDIQDDMADEHKLIYAECNMTSGAFKLATRSGFRVPEVETPHGKVDQVLYKNVHVGDGLPPFDDYRSFLFSVIK